MAYCKSLLVLLCLFLTSCGRGYLLIGKVISVQNVSESKIIDISDKIEITSTSDLSIAGKIDSVTALLIKEPFTPLGHTKVRQIIHPNANGDYDPLTRPQKAIYTQDNGFFSLKLMDLL